MVTRGRGTINQNRLIVPARRRAAPASTLPFGAALHTLWSCSNRQGLSKPAATSFHDKLPVDMVSDDQARLRHPANYLPVRQSRSHPAFQCWRHIRPREGQESSELSSSQAIQVPSSLPVLAAHSAKGESHLAECAGSRPSQAQASSESYNSHKQPRPTITAERDGRGPGLLVPMKVPGIPGPIQLSKTP